MKYAIVIALMLGLAWTGWGVGGIKGTAVYPDWTPSNITTHVWLDAQDINTIQRNGLYVTNWLDKSGNGRNATAILSVGPTFLTNEFPCLYNTNGSAMLGSCVLTTKTASAFIARKIPSPPSFPGRVITFERRPGCDYINSDCALAIGDMGTTPWQAIMREQDWKAQAYTPSGTSNIYISSVIFYADKCTTAINISYSGTNAHFATFGSTNYVVMNYRNRAFPTYGPYYEIVILDYAPSDEDKARLEGYLAWKYNITNSLPASHPYKFARPKVMP